MCRVSLKAGIQRSVFWSERKHETPTRVNGKFVVMGGDN
jgi:hypothetical protein